MRVSSGSIGKASYYYLANDGYLYNNSNEQQLNGVVFADFTITDGQITSLKLKQPVHLLTWDDFNNVIADNSSNIAGYAFPADKNVDMTLGASGASYTAPANGWICLSKKSTAANQYLQLYNSSISVQTRSHASANNVIAYLPLRKGDQFWVTYDLGGATSYFRFTYAQGDI